MSEAEAISRAEALSGQTREFERENDHVFVLNQEDNPDAIIVFFHGLLYAYEAERQHAFWSTWRERGNDNCWPITLLPEHLLVKKKMDCRLRILAVSYDSRILVKNADEYLLSENFIQDLVMSGVCQNDHEDHIRAGRKPDVPIILVGHDMGGILIKSFILQVEQEEATAGPGDDRDKLRSFLKNLKAVLFYATPSSGSDVIQRIANNIPEDTRSELLKLMRVLSSEVSRINSAFSVYRKPPAGAKQSRLIRTFAIVPTKKTRLDQYWTSLCKEDSKPVMVVEEGSARSDVDRYYSNEEADHFQVCQPGGLWSISVNLLSSVVHDQISNRRKIVRQEEIQEEIC